MASRILLAALVFEQTSAFLLQSRPFLVCTKLNYVEDQEDVPLPEVKEQKSSIWPEPDNLERAVDCVVEEDECDITELSKLINCK